VYLVLAWSVRRRNPLLRLKRPWVGNNLEVTDCFWHGKNHSKKLLYLFCDGDLWLWCAHWKMTFCHTVYITLLFWKSWVLIEIFSTWLQTLLEEAVHQKVVMEELNDRCEVLMELSACSWVRDSTVQLQATYTNLLTTVQVCVWKYLPFVIVVDFCDRFCLLLLPNETVVCDVDNDVCEHLKI